MTPGRRYHLLVEGPLPDSFGLAFPRLAIAAAPDGAHTTIDGTVADLSQLTALLMRLCDAGSTVVTMSALSRHVR